MKFLTSGKVKDVYEVDSDTLLFKFSNRVSAYDVKFKDEIPNKGEVLSKFAEYWFETLDVPNHFVETKSDTEKTSVSDNLIPGVDSSIFEQFREKFNLKQTESADEDKKVDTLTSANLTSVVELAVALIINAAVSYTHLTLPTNREV